MARRALLLLALGLALATAWVMVRDPDARRVDRGARAKSATPAPASEEPPAPIRLVGRPAEADPLGDEDPHVRPAPRLRDDRPRRPAVPRAPSSVEIGAVLWAVHDPVAPSARGTLGEGLVRAGTAFRLPRSSILGRVGAFGVRDGSGDASYDWLGVARITKEEDAADDEEAEVDDPLVTAVGGRVTSADGAPLAGAEVILHSAFYLRRAYYDHRVREIGRTFTNADGAFDLRPLALDTVHFGADGEVLLTIRHPHHADIVVRRLPNIRPEVENDLGAFVLPDDPVVIHGRIVDLAGDPVEGAFVRASGSVNPVDYDKVERMVVLKDCPTAITDADGRYRLTGFAAGVHEISVHVNIDCVLHVSARWEGNRAWNVSVRAGGSVFGRVLDASGEPIANAVVSGGGNWTPSNDDGSFWLDNIQGDPLVLEIAHHAFHAVRVPDVRAETEDLEVVMDRPLPRVRLEVVDPEGVPVPLVAIDWTWPPGRGVSPFVPDSRYWHDAAGLYEVIVPEGSPGAAVSDERGRRWIVPPEELIDGAELSIALRPPEPPDDGD